MKTGGRDLLKWAVRTALLSGAGLVATSVAFAAAPKGDEGIEKIIVTAQKVKRICRTCRSRYRPSRATR